MNKFIIYLLLLGTATASAQDLPVRTFKAKANAAKVLSAPATTDQATVAWEIDEPADQQFATSRDGRSITFFVDAPRVVVIMTVIDWKAQKYSKTKTVFVPDGPVPPGPEPGPNPPDPQPDVVPTGFAGEVYKQAKTINRHADCLRMAAVFENVSAQIAAGGLTTLEAASAELSRQNDALNLDAAWRSFGQWLSTQLGNNAQTLPQAKDIFAEVAKGLNAAGGKR